MARTLTEKRLTELLKYSEADICDFKETIYHIEDDVSKISFLKDILAMSNTIRYEPAYIIIGIRQKDGHNEFFDVDPNIDENNYISFIKGSVGPEYPEFTYYTLKYKKHIIGVFEIGISGNGPFFSKKNYGDKIKKEQIYYRYGSVNTEADEVKIQEIKRWMNSRKSDNYKLIAKQLELENQDRYNYILFIGEDYRLSKQQCELISNMKWTMIVDYTRGTEERGLYKCFHNETVSRHRITPEVDKIPQFYEDKTLFWYLAPNANKAGTENIVDTRQWTRTYFKSINECISKVIASLDKKVIFVSMYMGECKTASVDNLVDANSETPLFYKHVDISINQKFSLDNSTEYVEIQCLCDDVCDAFAHNRNICLGEDDYFMLQDEQFIINNPTWLHEEMTPLYENIEKMEEFHTNTKFTYFQGREIQWDELNPCIAANRKKYRELIEQVSQAIKRNWAHSDLIKIDYEAGAGVTTIMRMIAWYFHENVPVVILNQYSSEGTRQRLSSISLDVKRHRILLVIDIHDFDIQLVNELMRNLDVDNIPVTILYSRRHMGGEVENYLEEQLRGNEITAFDNIYNRQLDFMMISDKDKEQRKMALKGIQNENPSMITPFVYALCTYEESFVKLSNYVQEHIGVAQDIQKEILSFISVIHYYTGMEVPITIVQKIIEKSGIKVLDRALSTKQYSLLLVNNDAVRPLHHSVSGELVKQMCAYGMTNSKAWRNKLETLLVFVIEELEIFKTNEKAMRILKALFLNQQSDNNIDDQKHFSYAIEDLPTNIAKKNILEMLCSKFSRNPYAYSNFARYYHYIEENEDAALENIQKALGITEDYTFYHIKGIILAKKMRVYIEKNTNEIIENYNSFVQKIYDVLQEVENAYDKSAELNIGNIAAYTSKINYLLSIVRAVQKNICPDITVAQMLCMDKYSWCNDYIAKAHETVENIKTIDMYMNMNHESDIGNYEGQIANLEGNISEAISGWNNLLSKKDVYHPTIRKNLVYGYFQQCNKQWLSLSSSKREYVQKLIMDNIQEEPDDANNIVQWFDFARNYEGNLKRTVDYFRQYVVKPDLQYYYRAMLTFFAYGIENEDKTYIKQGIEFSDKCEELAREKPNRRLLIDVYNLKGKDLKKIEKFKTFLKKSDNFNEALARVPKIRGCISKIDKPEIGWISMEKFGINIKFNPSYNSDRIYRQTKDEGVEVEFVLGFRLEGVFAFSVSDIVNL